MLTSELKGNRTLATVLFTDCVGFSARMSMNEEHTLDLIRRDLKLMTKICEAFEGRVLKSTGDGLLMCFSSAVKAVECAIAIQQAIAEVVRTLPPSDALMHRIGIHLADMYITATDVMGNGVNIAARLQTEADPGGICISQTVYDVAKHGLQLTTEYLGPRELKNIREVVPAYRILLDNQVTPDDPYAETVRFLEQSDNALRIRKLIFYVCKNNWENDESKLATLSMRGIIHEFLGLASNYEQLRSLLNKAVSTLSKQSEYSLVASDILKGVAKFYAPDQSLQLWQGELLPAGSEPEVTPDRPAVEARQQAIASQIDQHPDALRLKKLLYYVGHRQWESHPARLSQLSTAQLLETISQQAPDTRAVESLVRQFVQTLNKPSEYALVALTLLDYVRQLYAVAIAPESVASPPARPDSVPLSLEAAPEQPLYSAIAAQLEQDPHALRFKKLIFYICKGNWVQSSEQLIPIPMTALVEELHRIAPAFNQLQQALHLVVSNLSKPTEYSAIVKILLKTLYPLYYPPTVEPLTPVTQTLPAAAAPVIPIPPPLARPEAAAPVVAAPPVDARSPVSLFDVRLGILKYTNPLKAKILAFSALYSDFGFQDQDWFQLKTYDLDGLLRSLLTSCRNYTDLEHLLYSTARRIPQLEDLIQTADTLVKYLRSFYLHGNPTLLVSLAAVDDTRISLDDFEVATQELALPDGDDQTRGVLPPPVSSVSGEAEATQLNFSTGLVVSPDQSPSVEG